MKHWIIKFKKNYIYILFEKYWIINWSCLFLQGELTQTCIADFVIFITFGARKSAEPLPFGPSTKVLIFDWNGIKIRKSSLFDQFGVKYIFSKNLHRI